MRNDFHDLALIKPITWKQDNKELIYSDNEVYRF